MNITFTCPHCDHDVRREIDAAQSLLECPSCHRRISIPAGAIEGDQVTRCLVCPSTDLFIRKDFPQRVGVAIVVVGFVASSIAWAYTLPIWTFGILFATALVDVVLFALVPDALMCYRCGAQYRLTGEQQKHAAFNLETHERHRQIKARMEDRGQGSGGRDQPQPTASAAPTE